MAARAWVGRVLSFAESSVNSRHHEPLFCAHAHRYQPGGKFGDGRCGEPFENCRSSYVAAAAHSALCRWQVIELEDDDDEVEVMDMAVTAAFRPCELCNRAQGVRGLACCHHSICLPCLRIHVEAQVRGCSYRP